jgi:hypothetical protein
MPIKRKIKKSKSNTKKKRKNPTLVERIFGSRKIEGNDASIKVEDGRILLTGGFGSLPDVFKELNDIFAKSEDEIKFEFVPNSAPTKRYVLNKLEVKLTEKQERAKRFTEEEKLKRRPMNIMGMGR